MIELKQFLAYVSSGPSQRHSLDEGTGKLPPSVPPETQWGRKEGRLSLAEERVQRSTLSPFKGAS